MNASLRPPRAAVAAFLAALALAGCAGSDADPFNFSAPVVSSPAGPQERGAWVKPDADPDQRRQAIAQCRSVAAAQISRDRQIDTDRTVGSATLGTGSSSMQLSRSLRDHSQENRRRRLIMQCMRDKGWRLE
jgi:hypothetical protein